MRPTAGRHTSTWPTWGSVSSQAWREHTRAYPAVKPPASPAPSVSRRSGLCLYTTASTTIKSRWNCTLGSAVHAHVVVVKTPPPPFLPWGEATGAMGGNERRCYYEWALRCSRWNSGRCSVVLQVLGEVHGGHTATANLVVDCVAVG